MPGYSTLIVDGDNCWYDIPVDLNLADSGGFIYFGKCIPAPRRTT